METDKPRTMSVQKQYGKDTVIFATKDDHATPSTVVLPPSEPATGLITPEGEINWNCPCLGGMATGPCGVEFRDAFSCFHYSEAEPKGSDCYDAFKTMQDCFAKYPTVYNKTTGDDGEDDLDLDIASMANDQDNQTDADTANLLADEKSSSSMPPSLSSRENPSSDGKVDKAK